MVDLINALAGGMPKQNTLANTLQAMGAGFQGRGNEYQALQMSKRDKEEERLQKRKMLAAKDIQQVSKLLQSGNIDGANKLMENRVSAITRQGQDPSDTLEFMKLLKNDPVQALKDSQGIVEESYNRGLLERPEPPKVEFKDGQAITYNPDGTISASPVEGYVAPEKDRLAMEKTRAEIAKMSRPERTSRMKDAAAAGLQPGTPEYNAFLLRDNSTKVNVSAPSEMQSKILLFSNLMKRTSPVIDKIEDGLTSSDIWKQAAGDGTVANALVKSPEMRRYKAAQRQWSEGILRLQTGAAATDEEIERQNKTYFPQPGDDPETVKFKRTLRRNAEEGVKASGGSATQDWDVGGKQGETSNTGGIRISPEELNSISDVNKLKSIAEQM